MKNHLDINTWIDVSFGIAAVSILGYLFYLVNL